MQNLHLRRSRACEGSMLAPQDGAPASFSFAGCARLFAYHLGVIERLRSHPRWPQAIHVGASSGALAAVIAGAGVDAAMVMQLVKPGNTPANA